MISGFLSRARPGLPMGLGGLLIILAVGSGFLLASKPLAGAGALVFLLGAALWASRCLWTRRAPAGEPASRADAPPPPAVPPAHLPPEGMAAPPAHLPREATPAPPSPTPPERPALPVPLPRGSVPGARQPSGPAAPATAASGETDLPEEALNVRTFDELRSLAGPDDADFLPSLVSQFLADAEIRIPDICAAHAAGDALKMSRAAHGLKSSCHYLGALRLSRHCAELQRLGEAGDLRRSAPIVARLKEELARVRERLKEESAAVPEQG